MTSIRPTLAVAACLFGVALRAHADDPSLTLLPRTFIPINISDDGRVVVGYSTGAAIPMIWTARGGPVQLLGPEQQSVFGKCWAASADGSVVVGTMIYNGLQTPFRWTADTGMLPLNPEARGNAYAVSDDGMVITGDAGLSNESPGFVWDQYGFRDLAAPSGMMGGTTTVVSGDGMTLAGVANTGSLGNFVLWRGADWTAEPLRLSDGPQVPLLGYVNDISHDGSILVGIAEDRTGGGVRPIMWTPNEQRFLGPAGYIARRLSRDGRVVTGSTSSASGTAWIMTPSIEPMNLRDYIQQVHDIQVPAGQTFTQIFGVSADGRTLCGWGAPNHWFLSLPPQVQGDFNLDETKDALDYAAFIECFEGTGLLPPSAADLNGDGITDFFDLLEFFGDE